MQTFVLGYCNLQLLQFLHLTFDRNLLSYGETGAGLWY